MTDETNAQSSSPTRPSMRARQCNADYRWTVPKVKAFLLALEQCGRVAEAAKAVGMSRQSAYALRARLDGPKFREAFEGARRMGLRARAAASRLLARAGKGRALPRSTICAQPPRKPTYPGPMPTCWPRKPTCGPNKLT